MKCYTLSGGSVYIYATGGDALIDLEMIPDGLGVFSADVPWRLSPRVAVSEGVPEEGLKVLEMLLRGEGYSRVDAEVDALEDYFISGAEPMPLTAAPAEAEAATTIHQWTLDDHPVAQARASLRRPSRRRRIPKPTPLPRTK